MNVIRSLSAGLLLTVSMTAISAIAFAAEPSRSASRRLSGANSVVAPSVVQSAQLAVDEINAKGGVLGRQLALEVADDASGAAGAQKAFDALISQKKVDVLISMETSAARNAALPIVARGKTPYIYTSFYEGKSCSPSCTSTPGTRTASARSSTTSPSRRLPRAISDRFRLRVWRGMLASPRPTSRSRRKGRRENICRWMAAIGPRSSPS